MKAAYYFYHDSLILCYLNIEKKFIDFKETGVLGAYSTNHF